MIVFVPESVHYYFQRACLRELASLRGVSGDKVFDAEGNCVVFWIEETAAGTIAGAQYKCTTCATLLALCEHLSDVLVGMKTEDAQRLTAGWLLELHPEIPESKKDRAWVAMQALQSAVKKQLQEAKG
jgi:NifU-like protein involved in Fe-S cluster formation